MLSSKSVYGIFPKDALAFMKIATEDNTCSLSICCRCSKLYKYFV